MPEPTHDAEAHRRLNAHDKMLRDHDELFADFSDWAWGNDARGREGIEKRVRRNEVAVALLKYYGPAVIALLAVIAAGQWPALAAAINMLVH